MVAEPTPKKPRARKSVPKASAQPGATEKEQTLPETTLCADCKITYRHGAPTCLRCGRTTIVVTVRQIGLL